MSSAPTSPQNRFKSWEFVKTKMDSDPSVMVNLLNEINKKGVKLKKLQIRKASPNEYYKQSIEPYIKLNSTFAMNKKLKQYFIPLPAQDSSEEVY
jgi:hypothetical protein